MKKFVLFSMPRTGSTMFSSSISSHPKVRCYPTLFGRAFEIDRPGAFTAKFPHWASLERRCADIEAFLAEVYAASGAYEHVGFKHHIGADQGLTQHVLDQADYARFHIVRDNYLATYSSAKLVKSNLRLQDAGRDVGARKRVRFVAGDLEKHIARREADYARWKPAFDAAGVIEIPYAQARTPAGVETVWRALGIEATFDAGPRTAKRNSDDIVARFINPKAVEAWLQVNRRDDWATEA